MLRSAWHTPRAIAALGRRYLTGHRFGYYPLSLWERAGVRALGGGYRRNIGEARCPHPNPLPEGEGTRQTQGRAKRWPDQHCNAERSKGPTHPLWLRRGAQRFADKGSQLSERSEFCETPRNASTAGCPGAQRRGRRQWGRLFFGYFLLAKQKKVTRPPGRNPGSCLSKRKPHPSC